MLILCFKIRGKKNLVLEKALVAPLNLLVKFSTLQEYGVDKVFFLENNNVDSSQRNVVFLARGEKAATVDGVAGMCFFSSFKTSQSVGCVPAHSTFNFNWDLKVGWPDSPYSGQSVWIPRSISLLSAFSMECPLLSIRGKLYH